MRNALIAAAIGSDSRTASLIMDAAKRIKPPKFGGWRKLNGGRRNGRRSR